MVKQENSKAGAPNLLVPLIQKGSSALHQLDSELSRFQLLNEFQKKTKVPKSYAFILVVVALLALIAFDIGAALIVNILGFVCMS